MAYGLTVDAKLMGTTGLRAQCQPRRGGFSLGYRPICLGRFSALKIDLLLGAVRPVGYQWQVYMPGLVLNVSPHAGYVRLFNISFFKLKSEVALRWRGSGKDHDARGGVIQSMDE